MTPRGIIVVVVVGVAALLLAWGLARGVYFGPRDAMLARLEAARAASAQFEARLSERARDGRALEAIAATSLGTEVDLVRHHLRTSLASIAMAQGLVDVVVSDGSPDAAPNPAGTARIQGALGQALRRQVDAGVLRGQVRGTGSFEACLRTLAQVQAQAWVHRVEGFGLKPADKARKTFELRIDLATLMLEGAPPIGEGGPAIADIPSERSGVIGSLASANPFVAPPPPPAPVVVERAPPAPPPAAPPPPPFREWRLVGVVQAGDGVEAWLARDRGGERVVLAPGGSILGLRLLRAEGERAFFVDGEAVVTLRTGQTLADRVVTP